ncbi:MAG TPA: glycosyltransferase [Usitatibacter sp.]|nr:glycosyltransferase [Usitatibacter sp.]
MLRAEGPWALARAIRSAWRTQREADALDYPRWAATYASPGAVELAAMAAEAEAWTRKPLISVLMPVHDTPEALLRAAIDSVLAQAYPHWELCIADDGSMLGHVGPLLASYRARDARIKVATREASGNISAASNTALALATGELVALLDHDDELTPDALFHVAREVNAHPGTAMVYSDEDKRDAGGTLAHPHFKPDWNHDLFLSHNIAAHLCAYRTEVVLKAGGFREGFEGAQDYDLALRVLEAVGRERVRHIPRVLYHWRMVAGSTAVNAFEKDYAAKRARQAVEEHLRRRGIEATVETLGSLGVQRVRYLRPPAVPVATIDAIGVRARNEAARRSASSVLLFVGAGVGPMSAEATAELAVQAQRPGIGAVGGKLHDREGRVEWAGTVLGAGAAHRGRGRGEGGYMLRASLVQEVSAVSGDCLCVRRDLFEAAGGFDEKFEAAFADLDLSLRLAVLGHRSLFTPFAEFRRSSAAAPAPSCDAAALANHPREAALLRERWGPLLADDPQYNPNLSLDVPFALGWPPRGRTP